METTEQEVAAISSEEVIASFNEFYIAGSGPMNYDERLDIHAEWF